MEVQKTFSKLNTPLKFKFSGVSTLYCYVATFLIKPCSIFLQEAVRQEMERQVSMEQKMERLESSLDNLSTRFARLLSDFNSTQLKLKQRITKMEKVLTRDGDAVSNISAIEFDKWKKKYLRWNNSYCWI